MTILTATPPATEPLVLAELRAALNLAATHPSEAVLQGMEKAARGMVETYLRKRLITQTVTVVLDGFCDAIHIPIGPVQSIAELRYRDDAGTLQTLASSAYRLIRTGLPAAIIPATGRTWPSTLREPDVVEVDVVVGFGADGTAVPPEILQAMRLLVGHMNLRREATGDSTLAEVPFGVRDMLNPHRLWV